MAQGKILNAPYQGTLMDSVSPKRSGGAPQARRNGATGSTRGKGAQASVAGTTRAQHAEEAPIHSQSVGTPDYL